MSQQAIVIHGNNSSKTRQLIKYIIDKYGLIGTNKDDNQQIIELAKILQKYSISWRKHVAEEFVKRTGVQPIEQYDAPHLFIDDENIFYQIAQPAKLGNPIIYNDKVSNKVHLFEGKGNKDWNQSAPASTYFNYNNEPYNLERFIKTLEPTAKYIKSVDLAQ